MSDTHAGAHNHAHTHDPKVIRKNINALSRAIGHLSKVRDMVESNEDCSDVLIQLAAVKGELNNIGKVIIKEHIEHCIVHAIEEHDMEEIEKLKIAIDRFMK